MKTRIKIDTAILSAIIIFTGFLVQFTKFYPQDIFVDDILDFLGLLLILKGIFLRMTARGFKKAHSQNGHGLVTEGPYKVVRNPMYLGTFLLGTGFIMIVWPWWSVPVFSYIFYLRFIRQINREEKYLTETFKEQYLQYTKEVPRLFPRLSTLLRVKFKEIFPPEEVFATKEKWGLLIWPALAMLLELIQEKIVFGSTDLVKIILIFTLAAVVTAVRVWVGYRYA